METVRKPVGDGDWWAQHNSVPTNLPEDYLKDTRFNGIPRCVPFSAHHPGQHLLLPHPHSKCLIFPYTDLYCRLKSAASIKASPGVTLLGVLDHLHPSWLNNWITIVETDEEPWLYGCNCVSMIMLGCVFVCECICVWECVWVCVRVCMRVYVCSFCLLKKCTRWVYCICKWA